MGTDSFYHVHYHQEALSAEQKIHWYISVAANSGLRIAKTVESTIVTDYPVHKFMQIYMHTVLIDS